MPNLTGRMELFIERSRLTRVKRNLTQAGLAECAGLHPNAVSLYERGDRAPRLDIVASVAAALNVSTDFLLGLTNNEVREVEATALTTRYAGLSAANQAVARKIMEVLYNESNTS